MSQGPQMSAAQRRLLSKVLAESESYEATHHELQPAQRLMDLGLFEYRDRRLRDGSENTYGVQCVPTAACLRDWTRRESEADA